jgi:hypothetical protein
VSRPPGRGSALTQDERREIQRLSIVGRCSVADIARRTDRDRGTVANVLQSGESQALRQQLETDAREEVLRLLKASGPQAAREWAHAVTQAANKGDHRAARDLLLHAGLIDPVPDDGNQGTRILIQIGTPEHPMRVQSPLARLEGGEADGWD